MTVVHVPPPADADNPDRLRLRKQGRMVRERLAANSAVYRVPAEQAEIWAVGDFLTAEECGRLMALTDAVARPSSAFDAEYSSGYRTSYSGDPDAHDPFVKRIQRRI